jgi:hypothetical protein
MFEVLVDQRTRRDYHRSLQNGQHHPPDRPLLLATPPCAS